MSSPYSARYLVLLPTQPAPCALLFNREHDFLAELDGDDGEVVDHLVRAGTPCPPPPALPLPEVDVDTPGGIQCYRLG